MKTYHVVEFKDHESHGGGVEIAAELGPVRGIPHRRAIVSDKQLAALKEARSKGEHLRFVVVSGDGARPPKSARRLRSQGKSEAKP